MEEARRVCGLECGAFCCRQSSDVLMGQEELDRLVAAAHKIGKDVTVQQPPGGEGWLLKMPCTLLEGTICSVYEDRPLACRAFPLKKNTPLCRISGWTPPPKVFIGVPRGGRTDDQWLINFGKMTGWLRDKGMLARDPLHIWGARVDNNRNQLCYQFLRNSDAQYLLMVDDDMQFPPPTGQVMAETMAKNNLDILGAVYFQRGSDMRAHVYRHGGARMDDAGEFGEFFETIGGDLRDLYLDLIPQSGGKFEDKPTLINNAPVWPVDATGTGCIMINRRVLERMPYPWFRQQHSTGGDLMFCWRAKQEAGFQSWTATGIICTHSFHSAVGVRSFLGEEIGV
jgi:hypothetical protein